MNMAETVFQILAIQAGVLREDPLVNSLRSFMINEANCVKAVTEKKETLCWVVGEGAGEMEVL